MRNKQLRAAVVGCRMGQHHAKALAALSMYELVALCDIREEAAAELAGQTGCHCVYTDYSLMLKEIRPDVVVIATPNNLHAPMTLEAANTGVSGIYCEKPMAVSLGEAQAMLAVCREKGISLVVGHQRRMSPVYKTMRKLIKEGVLGDVYLLRGTCAGDILSDGTHTLDSMLYLTGDEDIRWVLGQIYRGPSEPPEVVAENPWAFTGRRYGHAVERGAMAAFEFVSGIRGEALTGEARFPGRAYQDIEVFGSKGRLWRAGDSAGDEVLLMSEATGGKWEPVSLCVDDGDGSFEDVFGRFAGMIREGEYHPLNGENAMRSFEAVMAIYESARLRARIELPLLQERFPLDVLIKEGYE